MPPAARPRCGQTPLAPPSARRSRIAAAERRGTSARDHHTEVTRRTDALRSRLAGTTSTLAEIEGDVAEPRCAAPSARPGLSAISDTQADRADGRRPAGAHRRAAGRAGRGRRRLRIVWRARSRCGTSGWPRSFRIMAAGATAWPRPIARSPTRGAARADRRDPRRARGQAGRDRGQARGAGRARSPRPRQNRRRRPTRWPSARRQLAEADKTLKQSEGELAGARESRVRREGQVEQATQRPRGGGRAHRRAAALRARWRAGAGRGPDAGGAAGARQGRASARSTGQRARDHGRGQSARRGRGQRARATDRGHDQRARRSGLRDRAAAPGHPEPQSRRPRAFRRRVRAGQRRISSSSSPSCSAAARRELRLDRDRRIRWKRASRSMPVRRARSCR